MKRKSLSKKLVFLVVMATTMSNFTAYAGKCIRMKLYM